MKHREENGRTYHAYKDGKYSFPNDDDEASRLDLQHHIHLLANDGKLATAPFDKDFPIHRVLDVGTGTGIWAIDYADENPQTKVLGIDLSPIQPDFLPTNCSFEIDDVEETWTYQEKFDFIHARIMTGSIANWPRFFEQAFEFSSPGAYIELTDQICPIRCDDGTLPENSALKKWSELLLESTLKVGRGFDSSLYYGEQLKNAGFVDIKLEVAKWPMNQWPKDKKLKEIGIWQRENLLAGAQGISIALFTRILGWTPEEVEVVSDVRMTCSWRNKC